MLTIAPRRNLRWLLAAVVLAVLGLLVASVLGFLTSILAHNVLTSGDTLAVRQQAMAWKREPLSWQQAPNDAFSAHR